MYIYNLTFFPSFSLSVSLSLISSCLLSFFPFLFVYLDASIAAILLKRTLQSNDTVKRIAYIVVVFQLTSCLGMSLTHNSFYILYTCLKFARIFIYIYIPAVVNQRDRVYPILRLLRESRIAAVVQQETLSVT